jgi:pyruvate dehydrogenase E2 component (dihydrolipoamide acetyltransferase)
VATVTEVLVPDIGDFDDIPVIEILVAVGDTVAVEDPLVTLESDKASMDVPSPAAGVVAELRVALGDHVSEGSVLLTLSAGDTPEQAPAAPEPPVAPAAVAEPDHGAPAYASPTARRLARELAVDLSTITGTGRKGRITNDDVRAAAAGGATAAPPPPGPATAGVAGLEIAPWPKVDFAEYGEIERVGLSRIQKLAKANLARNWVMIPHVTHHDEADITDLEAFRKETNAAHAEEGVKLTMVALLLKAVVASLKAFPQFNASLDGDELVLKHYHHLGFAADTPDGLVVPVIRDVDKLGLLEVAAQLAELSGKARDGSLKIGQMTGGTFTISSLGGIGGTGFTPIVNAPEVAILGVTRAATKPVWDGGAFIPRLIVALSLSYDHRVIDGAAAARFTAHLAGVLGDFRRALL